MAAKHFKSELREAAGLELLQLKLVFYKPVYNCSFLFSRGQYLLNCTAVLAIYIPGYEFFLVHLKMGTLR